MKRYDITLPAPIKHDTTAQQVADYLTTHGLDIVTKVEERNEEMDGEITLRSGWHVIVAKGYVLLCLAETPSAVEEEQGTVRITTYPSRTDLGRILIDILAYVPVETLLGK